MKQIMAYNVKGNKNKVLNCKKSFVWLKVVRVKSME